MDADSTRGVEGTSTAMFFSLPLLTVGCAGEIEKGTETACFPFIFVSNLISQNAVPGLSSA